MFQITSVSSVPGWFHLGYVILNLKVLYRAVAHNEKHGESGIAGWFNNI